MFKAKGRINEEIMKSVKKHLMPIKNRVFFKTAIISSIVFGILNFTLGLFELQSYFRSIMYSIFFACLAGGFTIEYFYFINKICKLSLQMLEENTGKTEIEYEIYFDEVEIRLSNLTTEGESKLKYKSFVRFERVANMYILFTEANQNIIMFRESIDANKISEFESFITEKCTNKKFKSKLY